MNKWMIWRALAIPATDVAQNAGPAGNAENGKRPFLKNSCYECHGTVGQGVQANPLAPKLAR
jgi:mono/diheme cytochrome c family protein